MNENSLLFLSFLVPLVFGDGVCGPTYVQSCGQFSSMVGCTCNPAASPQACQLAPQLEYYTYDPITKLFMYCQWQFVTASGAMQCAGSSKCTPSTDPAYEVCQSNLQASQSQSQQLQAQIAQLNLQILDLQANATRLTYQLAQQQNENQGLRLELAQNNIFTALFLNADTYNVTMERLYDNALNWSYTEALRNESYYQRSICPLHYKCCPNSG